MKACVKCKYSGPDRLFTAGYCPSCHWGSSAYGQQAMKEKAEWMKVRKAPAKSATTSHQSFASTYKPKPASPLPTASKKALPPGEKECIICKQVGPSRLFDGGSTCPRCENTASGQSGYQQRERQSEWSAIQQKRGQDERRMKAMQKERAEERATEQAIRNHSANRCSYCKNDKGPGHQCISEEEQSYRDLETKAIVYDAFKGRKTEVSVASLSGSRRLLACPHNKNEVKVCQCLIPVIKGESNTLAPAAENSTPFSDRALSNLKEIFNKYNATLALTALEICKHILNVFFIGPGAQLASGAKVDANAVWNLRFLSLNTQKEGSTVPTDEGIKHAESALKYFCIDQPQSQDSQDEQRWCPIARKNKQQLLFLIGAIWDYIAVGCIMTVHLPVESQGPRLKARPGTWMRADIRTRREELFRLRDYVLVNQVLPSILASIETKEYAAILAEHAANLAMDGSFGQRLNGWLTQFGLPQKDFNRICVLAHARRLSVLFAKDPGKEFLKDNYTQFRKAIDGSIQKIVTDLVLSPIAPKGFYQTGKAQSTPGASGAMGTMDVVSNVDAALGLAWSPMGSWGGGSTFNYISVLWGGEGALERSRVGFKDGGKEVEHYASTSPSGFLTCSSWATQTQVIGSLAQIGRLIHNDDAMDEWRQKSVQDKVLDIWKGTGNAYQASAGVAANLANASSQVSTALGLASIGVGTVNSVINVVQDSQRMVDIRTGELEIQKRFKALDNIKMRVSGEGIARLDQATLTSGATKAPAVVVKAKDATPDHFYNPKASTSISTFQTSYGRSGCGLFSSIWGLGSSLFTLSVAIESAVAGNALAASMIVGGTMGLAIPVVGWCLVGVALVMGMGLLAYDSYQSWKAEKAVRKHGMHVAAKDSDDVKLAEACILMHAAALLPPVEPVTPAGEAIMALQALNWALFKDVALNNLSEDAPTVQQEWSAANLFAQNAGPEGLYNTWLQIRGALEAGS